MKLKKPLRNKITLEQFVAEAEKLPLAAKLHLETYGDGVFISHHEILGMATDQMNKLNSSVTKTVYSKEAEELYQRCHKFALGLIFAAASLKAESEE